MSDTDAADNEDASNPPIGSSLVQPEGAAQLPPSAAATAAAAAVGEGAVVEGAEQPADRPGQGDAADLAAEFADSVSIRSTSYSGDGNIEVKVAEDWMSATATLSPPRDDGRPISPDAAAEMLARVGVTEGILWDVIKETILECNLERHYIRDRVVAEATLPSEEVPEHAAIEPRFAHRERFASPDAIKVDFRVLSSLPVVKKGEVLARIVPRSEGRVGRDIRGKELPVPRRQIEHWKAGKNVEIVDGELRAAVEGLLLKAADTLAVEEVFIVKGGVDYHTGHIVFPGDVIIEGKVSDGFKVWSGANIFCKVTLDAFDVNAKHDLNCQQGIIGRRNGQVRVGGRLGAKFIENCRVAARGDVVVTSAIMGSRVFSLGTVDLGEKGVIMGGETWAVHGIKAARLGNQARQRTVLHVGVDFTVQQRLDQANERLRIITLRAQQIDVFAASHPGVDAVRLHKEAEKALGETRALILKLLGSLDGDDAAMVEVKGEIFPGTVIDICRVEISVDEKLQGCRFRLDKAAGRIHIEHLGAKPTEASAKDAAKDVAKDAAKAPPKPMAPSTAPKNPGPAAP